MRERPDDEMTPQRLLLAAAGVTIVVGLLTVSVGWFTNIGLVLATLAVVGALGVLAQRLLQSHQHLHWETSTSGTDARRGADSRVTTLRHEIELATSGDAEAQGRVHTLLTGLADERLRDCRGLQRGEDPRTAALLGPDLTAYLDHRPPGRLTTDQLHRHVQKLEELS
jgi:hypothetical protein